MKVLKTSEFWMSIVTAIIPILSHNGLVPKETGDQGALATGAYVLGRIISKLAKRGS